MKKSCFFAAFLFASLLTLGTAGNAAAHDHDDHWGHRPAWGHRWRGDRWERGRWAYGQGYANPWWRGDDDDWRGYRRYPYGGYEHHRYRGFWHRLDRDDD